MRAIIHNQVQLLVLLIIDDFVEAHDMSVYIAAELLENVYLLLDIQFTHSIFIVGFLPFWLLYRKLFKCMIFLCKHYSTICTTTQVLDYTVLIVRRIKLVVIPLDARLRFNHRWRCSLLLRQ